MKLIFGILTIGLLLCHTAAGDVVYTWTDDDGVKHFSDTPPVFALNRDRLPDQVETIPMPGSFPAPKDPEADYYSITNQWQRMQEDLLARERLALQREELEIERARLREQDRETVVANTPVVVTGGYHTGRLFPLVSARHTLGHFPFVHHGLHTTSPAHPHHPKLTDQRIHGIRPHQRARHPGISSSVAVQRAVGSSAGSQAARPLNSR